MNFSLIKWYKDRMIYNNLLFLRYIPLFLANYVVSIIDVTSKIRIYQLLLYLQMH